MDACFLSNPYATDLFLDYLHREVIRTGKLRTAGILSLAEPRDRRQAQRLWNARRVPLRRQRGGGDHSGHFAPLHWQQDPGKLADIFSYHDFRAFGYSGLFNVLPREDDFHFDPTGYLERVRRQRPDTVVLINPNNPDGGYIPYATMIGLLEELRDVPNVIVDESFIHFACEGIGYAYWSVADEVRRFPNLTVVKSMSKDFGVAGIRAGYAVMAPERVRTLLDNGYLWNSSGLAEYFFDLYSRPDFQERYERERIRFIRTPDVSSRRWPRSRACAPIRPGELRAGGAAERPDAEDLVWRLLVRRGIYTRTCDDKRGLEPGKFVRIAARNRPENRFVLAPFRDILR